MTKLLRVRIEVPCDDATTTAMLAEATHAALEGLPTTRIPIEGSTQTGRIHWSAVAVKRGADPEEPKAPPTRSRKTVPAP